MFLFELDDLNKKLDASEAGVKVCFGHSNNILCIMRALFS